jgi:acyl-coenzyme A synthetase/AMP-(fatty) acid ligase
MIYDRKGDEPFSYQSLSNELLVEGELEVPINHLIFKTSGSTGVSKFVFHDKAKTMNKIVKNHQEKHSAEHTLIMLHHGHIAWWESVLTLLLSPHDLYIVDGLPLEGKSYPKELNIRTTPSYLRLSFSKGLFHDEKKYSFSLGSEPISQNLIEKINDLDAELRVVYGSTEFWGISSSSLNKDTIIKLEGVQSQIIDGELVLNSCKYLYDYILELGELKKSQLPFYTQDIVNVHEQGIQIVGRINDYINVGGIKFHSSEVKNKVEELNFIEDSLVFPVKNVLLGEVVGLQIIINTKVSDYKEQIRELFEKKEMKPVHIEIVKDFERTSSKKTQRKL